MMVAQLRRVTHRYGAVTALDRVTLDIPAGTMAGLIGPDGVGKSTLLGLIAGAKRGQEGMVEVLGGDMSDQRRRRNVCARIAYMPQGLGRNLYADLTVVENIEFFGRLFGQSASERRRRIAELLASTGLSPFPDRFVRQLSGGMRQKLGLCCALMHDPDLLILDEPTTGVDPLSRRQFWDLIARMRGRRPGMSVLVATAYMEEADQFDWLAALDAGQVLASGAPAALEARTGSSTLEEAFIALLPEGRRAGHRTLTIPPRVKTTDAPAIVARDLTRRFGDFTAVDHASFDIQRGEIFGFVGANGCGKTTTMRMLTGLLPATSGDATVLGKPIAAAGLEDRRRVGYMSQSFSLYTELTVGQNLLLHARLFQLTGHRARSRIDTLIRQFGLAHHRDQPAGELPLGIRQRLSLAVAIVHEPEMLILDEPTSGVDPLARDAFWETLVDLSRRLGVTIFVSTHFMNEAARCDRIALMAAGRVLATDTPAALMAARRSATLEEAFVSYLQEAAGPAPVPDAAADTATRPAAVGRSPRLSVRRLWAYSVREGLEFIRDPIRVTFALFGTALLMLVFGAGISTDVDHLSFAVLDYDHSVESDTYLESLRGSPYFIERAPIADDADRLRRMASGGVSAAVEIPPGFGRRLQKGVPAEVSAVVDGAMPFRAATIEGYLQSAHSQYLADLATAHGVALLTPVAVIEPRFRYNQDFDSIYAMVPGTIAMLLALIPAILMALSIVREKEFGSITNLYVTPVTRLEFLIGKQLPYVAIAMVNCLLLVLLAVGFFGVPLKGSAVALLVATVLYVTATTGYGMVVSSFTRTQIAALFGTTILTVLPATQFCGLMTPVSSLSGIPAIMGRGFPMTYFLRVSVGTFTKALGFEALWSNIGAIALFIPVFTILSLAFLRKQER